MTTITAVNAVITLTIPGVFNQPQQLQQFAVDDVADVDTLTLCEELMGVDGVLSAGFVFNAVKYVYTLQANSPSCFVFDQWKLAQDAAQETFPANGNLLLKSLGTKWSWTRGFLKDYSPAPNVKKVLQPRKFGVVWQRVTPQPS
jgi:hypothetical protein